MAVFLRPYKFSDGVDFDLILLQMETVWKHNWASLRPTCTAQQTGRYLWEV